MADSQSDFLCKSVFLFMTLLVILVFLSMYIEESKARNKEGRFQSCVSVTNEFASCYESVYNGKQ